MSWQVEVAMGVPIIYSIHLVTNDCMPKDRRDTAHSIPLGFRFRRSYTASNAKRIAIIGDGTTSDTIFHVVANL